MSEMIVLSGKIAFVSSRNPKVESHYFLNKAVSNVFLFCLSLVVDNCVRGSLDTLDTAG